MALNYAQLLQFDLLDEADNSLVQPDNKDKFFEFINLTQSIWNVNQFIIDCPSFPGSTKEIVRDELVSAIGSTLAIEGILLQDDEIKNALQEQPLPLEAAIRIKEQYASNSRDVYHYIQGEVLNANQGFTYTQDQILTIHRLFTKNIESIGNRPGAYRSTQALFGYPRKTSLCENSEQVYQAMKFYVEWLNIEKKGLLSSNPIAKAIMAHYYLAEIHPFGDGNGRTARAVEAMALFHKGTNHYCFWSLANFWKADRSQYIAQLANIRDTCNPLEFILWGAGGYLAEVTRIKVKVLSKLRYLMLRDYVSWLLRTKKQQPSEKKINQRIHDVMVMLTTTDKIPLSEFRALPQYEALYTNKSSQSSRSKDLAKMKSMNLVRVSKVEEKEYIEPNYEVLEQLEYAIPR